MRMISRSGRDSWIRARIAALLGGLTVTAIGPVAAWGNDASAYVQSAHQLEKVHDYRGAEIQLRNAAEAAPGDGAIRIELAQVYLRLGNPNAAQAELFDARFRGVKEEVLAPLMAQALLQMGDFGDLLKNVPTGKRSPKTESLVRTYRGLAQLALGENDAARASLADAERLDPTSTVPLVGETRMLIEQRQFDAADRKADQVLKLDPKNADAFDAKGMILAGRGNIGAAMRQFNAAIAVDPHNRALLDRANLELDHNNLDAAERDLQAVRKFQPDSVIAVYLQAMIDTQRGNYRDADPLINRLRPAMNGFPPAFLLGAEVKFKLNQLDSAQDLAQRFIAKAGDSARAHALLGAIAAKRGDIDQSIGELEKAVNLAPKDGAALAALGQAYVAHGDLDKAKAVFDQAAVVAPGNAPLATERALTTFATGDRQASLAALSDIFRGGKGSIIAGPPLVIEALQLNRVDDAATAAEQLVSRDPKNAMYQELLAASRIGQRNYPAAEVLLRGLLAKQPNLASARRDLAQVYLETNRSAQAKTLYQDRLRTNPNDADSLGALADIAFRERDDNAAIALLTRAQNAIPHDPRPSLRILAGLETRKNWPDAIARARALQDRFPNDASVHDALAHLYFVSGNHGASLDAYKNAAAKFPKAAPIFAHYAAVLAGEKNYGAAAPIALRAAQLDPKSAELKRAFVILTYLSKGADAALAASRLVAADKTGPAAVLMTADVLEGNNNRTAATALLERQQARNPSSAVAVRLAALYQRSNRLDKASSLLESWAAAHPADPEPRFALAQIESMSGKLGQALAQYEWLANQTPYNPVILNNLAWLYDSKHDPRARAIAEKAIKLAPTSASVADTLGWILLEQGDTADAAKYLAQASASAPSDGAIQYHYAVVLSKMGKSGQARALLEKLLAAKPAPDTLASARTLLASLGPAH